MDAERWQDERIAEALRVHRDHETGRLPAAVCRELYLRIAHDFGLSWAAVALRVPAAWRPSAEEWAALGENPRRRSSCPGCAEQTCDDCRRSEMELGRFSVEELDEAVRWATAMGGVSYQDLMREKARRRARGIQW
jgi:hypothetical protein